MSAAEEIASKDQAARLATAQHHAVESWLNECSGAQIESPDIVVQAFLSGGSSPSGDLEYTVGADATSGWFSRALHFAVCCTYQRAVSSTHKWTQLLCAFQLRVAVASDVPALLSLIKELAEFEKEPDAVKIDEDTLLRDGFPTNTTPLFYVLVLEDSSGSVVGFALSFVSYSTWTGRNVYLEDLYITPSARRGGLGTMMIDTLVMAAAASGCSRVSWQALDWNEPAVKCYEKLGAHNEGQWLNYKLHAEDIKTRMAAALV